MISFKKLGTHSYNLSVYFIKISV